MNISRSHIRAVFQVADAPVGAPTQEPTVGEQPAPVTVASKMPATLQDVQSEFYHGETLGDAIALLEHITLKAQANEGGFVTPLMNGDWAQTGEFPPGYGILVLPIGITIPYGMNGEVLPQDAKAELVKERKRVTKAVVAAAVPTLETVLANDKGRDFLQGAMLGAYGAKTRNLYVRAENPAEITLPFSVDEWVEKSGPGIADQGLAAFRKIGPRLVKSLNGKGVPVNLVVLRQCLASKQFAEALFPNIGQGVWTKVLAAGKVLATEAKESTQIFDTWLSTRETTGSVTPSMDDIEL